MGRSWSGRERNCALLNVGGTRFACISGASGFDFPDDGRAVGVCDWDEDGDLDLWVVNRSGPQIRFLRNDEGNRRSYISFRLTGTTVNRDGIGARIEVSAEDTDGHELPPLVRTVRAGEGFLAQSTKWVHFGLGTGAKIRRVRVRWPGGTWEEFGGAAPDQRYRLVQGTGRSEPVPPAPRALVLAPQSWEAPPASQQKRVFFAQRVGLPSLPWSDFEAPMGSKDATASGPVLLNLWSRRCRPCLTELRELTARAADLRSAGINVVALCVDEPTADPSELDRARDLLSGIGFPFRAGTPRPGLLPKLEIIHGELLGTQRPYPVPSSFLVDHEGRLAALYQGPVSVDQILADVANLGASPEDRWAQALPFPGRQHHDAPRPNLLILAEVFREHGFADDASRVCEDAALRNPSDPIARFNFGFVLEQAGRIEEALTAYRRCTELAPGFAEAWKSIGTVLLGQGKLEEARPALQRAIAIDPAHATAHSNLGMVLLQGGRGEEALLHFRSACDASPELPLVHMNLALGLNSLGRFEEGLSHLDDWVRSQPRSAPALLCRANYLARAGRLIDAEAGCRRAIQLTPDDPDGWNSLGIVLSLRGQAGEAATAFTRVLALNPEYPKARERLVEMRRLARGK